MKTLIKYFNLPVNRKNLFTTLSLPGLIALLMGTLLLNSCDVLNVESEDSIPADKAFKDKTGVEQGILGSYDAMQSLSYYGRTYLTFSDLAADNLKHSTDGTKSDYAEVDNFSLLPENSAVEGMWNAIYNAINTANSVIVNIPGVSDMTETEKNKALGELYFIRALCYFNLINYFGPCPLKTTPTVGTGNLDIAASSTDDIYTQIIEDLTFAESNLDASASLKIRAGKYAAAALLARVYLYHGQYDLAYEAADRVIKNGGYTLLSNFSDVFAADNCAESIFEIDYTETDRNRLAEYNFPKSLNGTYEVSPTASLISAFTSNDERSAVTIAYDGSNAYANKYNDLSKGAENVIILRLAEMYLIRAEAAAHQTSSAISGIQSDINTIRNRAGLDNTTAGTKAELLTIIEEERRLEFAFEGHRWFDLKRTNRALTVLSGLDEEFRLLFPIPNSELFSNSKMIQNTGY